MKRALSLSLALLTLATVSCGGGSGSTETTAAQNETTTAAPEPSRFDELGAKDFEGKKFHILDASDHPTTHINMPGEEMTGDILNDALFARDAAIEALYNIDITYEQIVYAADGRTALRNSVAAGDNTYQLMITPLLGDGSLANMPSEGILAPLSDSEYISLDADWWSSLMYDSLRLKDKMYYTTGDISATMYKMPACVFLNCELADDYGFSADDVVTLVRDGKWTLDALYNYVKDVDRDVDDDGVMHCSTDFFGFSFGNGALTTNALLSSAGVNFTELTDDRSNILLSLENEHTVTIAEKVGKLVKGFNFKQDDNYGFAKAFTESRSLFAYHFTASAEARFRDMKDDYIILPMPKGDETQEQYRSFANCWAGAFIGIPVTADFDYVSFITEAMGYYSYKNVRPKAYDLIYTQKITRHDASAEMLDLIFNTLYVDFGLVNEFGDISNVMMRVCNGSALTTELAAVKSQIEAQIAALVENW